MAIEHILPIITYLSILNPLLGLILGHKGGKHFIWRYLLFMLLFDIAIRISIWLGYTTFKNALVNIYCLTNFFFLSNYFYSKLKKKYTWFLSIGLIALVIALIHLFNNGIKTFDGIFAATLSFSYLFYCIIGLFSILINEETTQLSKSSFFYFICGVLIYNSSTILLLAFSNYYQLNKEGIKLLSSLWIAHDLANIIQGLLYYKAILLELDKNHLIKPKEYTHK